MSALSTQAQSWTASAPAAGTFYIYNVGAEKFLDIKCREAGLKVSAVVLVATLKALKYHGGVDKKEVQQENVEALKAGLVNLEKHIDTLNGFGIPYVVALNHFASDTDAEIKA